MSDQVPTAVPVNVDDVDNRCEILEASRADIYVDASTASIHVSEDIIVCYSLATSVRYFAIVDLVFSIVYVFFNTYFIIPLVFAVVGYLGGKHYSRVCALIYLVFILITNAFRVGVLVNDYSQSPDKNTYLGSIIWVGVCGLIELWVAKIVYHFCVSMGKISRTELQDLRMIDRLEGYRVIMW